MNAEYETCNVCFCLIEPDDLPENYCYLPVCESCLPLTLESLSVEAVNAAITKAKKVLLDRSIANVNKHVLYEKGSAKVSGALRGSGGAQSEVDSD